MGNVRRWSSSASGNATVTGGVNAINFAEGQAPSTVNNSARELMAQVRGIYTPSEWGWIEHSATASIVNQTSFKISGNQTGDWTNGRRMRLKSGSTTRYGSVVSSSYTTETTVTVRVDSGSLSASHSIAALSVLDTYSNATNSVINVRTYGAKGDGVTDDTTAITAAVTAGWTNSLPVYFPAGTYMCNLSLSGSNAIWGSRINWQGDGRNLTILKAFDNTKDTVRFIASDELSFQRFKGFRVHGNDGTANHAWRVNANHDSVYEDFYCSNAWIAFRHDNSFGCSFSNCVFGVSSSYGYVGIGSSVAYSGWHTFKNGCWFRGSKVAYHVDNSSAPAGEGNGNIHDRSDWQGVTGLCVFMRNQGADKTEVWRNPWFEGNASSGTVDVSDLPSPSASLGTLTIPTSGVIIHSGTTSASGTYQKSRIYVEGGFVGADVLGDCEIIADRMVGIINKSTSTPNAIITAKARQYDPFSPSATYSIVECVVDFLDYATGIQPSSTYSSYVWGALGTKKTTIEYNTNLLNSFICSSIDATGVSTGFAFDGAGSVTVSTALGGIQGRCYVVTLNSGETIDLKGNVGAGGGLSNALGGYNVPVAFSFAILSSTTTAIPLEMLRVTNVGTGEQRSVTGYISAEMEWKTYNVVSTLAAYRPALKNNSGSTVTFYLTDLQAVNGNGGSTRIEKHRLVLNHITSNKLAGCFTGGTKITP